jgi:hypothetical protein
MATFKSNTQKISNTSVLSWQMGHVDQLSQKTDSNKQWKSTKYCYPFQDSSLLTPIITYGPKTTTLTKRIRSAIRRYESRIIHDMMETTHDYIPINPSMNCYKVYSLNSLYFPPTLWFHSIARTVTRRIRAPRMRYWGHIRRRPQNYILQVALRYTSRK